MLDQQFRLLVYHDHELNQVLGNLGIFKGTLEISPWHLIIGFGDVEGQQCSTAHGSNATTLASRM